MSRTRALTTLLLIAIIGAMAAPVLAQLPPEAVLLDKVKIPEVIKSDQLDPVSLKPVASGAQSWTYQGVAYKGSNKAEFDKNPAKYAAAAKRERYVLNFMKAMSTIWCPITDEVTPGGRKQVEGLGYTWESCCSFCDEEMVPENFKEALAHLRKRGELSFELTGGVYTEGASSPVEGAIDENV